jgi:anti-sigma B factor antagonist
MQSTLAHSKTTVVQPSGHINVNNAATLKQKLTETVASNESSSLLIDMSRVESLDSHGLMALVSTMTLAQRLNKRFGLFGLSPSVRIVFELTQLDRVFEIVESHPAELEAVAA